MTREILVVGAVTLSAACGGSENKDLQNKPLYPSSSALSGPIQSGNSGGLSVVEFGNSIDCVADPSSKSETKFLVQGQEFKVRNVLSARVQRPNELYVIEGKIGTGVDTPLGGGLVVILAPDRGVKSRIITTPDAQDRKLGMTVTAEFECEPVNLG